MKIESILLAVTQVFTFKKTKGLTTATGAFFEREQRLYLITNHHVVQDLDGGHEPDRLEIDLHTNLNNIAETVRYSIPLYDDQGGPLWLKTTDSSGLVDIVAILIEAENFPPNTQYQAFGMENLVENMQDIEIGTSVRVVGHPLGFADCLHHLPVMRHAIIASSFSLRFQGYGYFLTDSLLHRGASGSPVVMRTTELISGREDFPWMLLGIHAGRIDMEHRDEKEDERLNLFNTWYADVLRTLTAKN
jgi:S1-C subfamily serine protease